MPRVPPAQIVPAESPVSYPVFFMTGAAISPMMVTDAPTIPVAAANSVAVKMVPMYSEPLSAAGDEQHGPEETFHEPRALQDAPHEGEKGHRGQDGVHHRPEEGKGHQEEHLLAETDIAEHHAQGDQREGYGETQYR